MQVISKVFLYLLVLFISACTSLSAEQTSLSKQQAQPSEKQAILLKQKAATQEGKPMIKMHQSWQQFTVKYINLEGGFFGLVSEKGAKLLPMNLPKQYRVNGTILRIKGEPIKNIMTIQQWGQPFKVIDVELIKMGTGKSTTHQDML